MKALTSSTWLTGFVLIPFYAWIFYQHYSNPTLNAYKDIWASTTDASTFVPPPYPERADPTRPFALSELDYFLQITDLHINTFDPQSLQHLETFLDKVLPLYFIPLASKRPLFVAVTGDLTDGKDAYGFKTYQNEQDWIMYRNAIVSRNYHTIPDFWLDLPGNHDRFDVLGDKSYQLLTFNATDYHQNDDFYRIYGIQGSSLGLGYQKIIYSHALQSSISVTALDATPLPGFARPFNFFGYLNPLQMDLFHNQTFSQSQIPPLYRVLLCHYPPSIMQAYDSESLHFGNLVRSHYGIFLSGHLHNLLSILGGRHLFSTKLDIANLELGDLKRSRDFRIVSYHRGGSYSFSDHLIPSRNDDHLLFIHPISPKDDRFRLEKESSPLLSHAQFLIFSDSSLLSLNFTIDNVSIDISNPLSEFQTTYPLLTIPLNLPFSLRDSPSKIHTLFLAVQSQTSFQSVSFEFTQDGTALPIGGHPLGPLLMEASFESLFRFIFWLGYILLWCFYFILPNLIVYRRHYLKNEPKSYLLQRLCQCAYERPLFRYFWLLYLCYIPIGPLSFGYYCSSAPFLLYTIGFYQPSSSSWIPLVDSWEYSAFYMLGFLLPVTFLHILNSRSPFPKSYGFAIGMWWCFQGLLHFLLWMAYSPLNFFLSPGMTWCYFSQLYFYYSY